MRGQFLKALWVLKKLANKTLGRGISNKFYWGKVIYTRLLSRLKKPDRVVEIFGNKMYLDIKDTLNLSVWGEFEPFQTEVFKKEIKGGDIVLDIGAHIGYCTLIAAKIVGPQGKVFAFEPEPSNFSLLQKNIELNHYKNIELIQKAVSDKSGRVKLFLYEDTEGDPRLGDHRIFDLGDNRKFIKTEAVSLDDYFRNYRGKIDLIKMDVEGAESGVISGMKSLLSKNYALKIITEFFPLGIQGFGGNPRKFLEFFTEAGFKLFNINENKKKLEPVIINDLFEVYNPKTQTATNLLCIRE
jgi:FkbM family methyltransferase